MHAQNNVTTDLVRIYNTLRDTKPVLGGHSQTIHQVAMTMVGEAFLLLNDERVKPAENMAERLERVMSSINRVHEAATMFAKGEMLAEKLKQEKA